MKVLIDTMPDINTAEAVKWWEGLKQSAYRRGRKNDKTQVDAVISHIIREFGVKGERHRALLMALAGDQVKHKELAEGVERYLQVHGNQYDVSSGLFALVVAAGVLPVGKALEWWKEAKEEMANAYQAMYNKRMSNGEQAYAVLASLAKLDFDNDGIRDYYRNIFGLLAEHKGIQKEFANAARAVEKGTHEQVNAASQAFFCINVSLGLFEGETAAKVMERTALGVDGAVLSITNIAQWQRIPTVELLTTPVVIERGTNWAKWAPNDIGKVALAGHTGAAYLGRHSVVPPEAASRSGIHADQLRAQQESSHHITYSGRLSRYMDNVQCRGTTILYYFDAYGFSSESNWNGFYIKDNTLSALAVAVKAEYHYKKRRTAEKALRLEYADPASASDYYTEARSASEVYTEDKDDFVRKIIQDSKYQDFINNPRHGLINKREANYYNQFTARLEARIEELEECLER